jgi:hypothetical protein
MNFARVYNGSQKVDSSAALKMQNPMPKVARSTPTNADHCATLYMRKMCPPAVWIDLTIRTVGLSVVFSRPKSTSASPHYLPLSTCAPRRRLALPIINPTAIRLHKLLTRLLERQVRPQLTDLQRLPCQRIRRAPLKMLNQRCPLITPPIIRDHGVRHDLECDPIDQVVRHLAFLLVLWVGDGKRSAQVIALLFELLLPIDFLLVALCSADFAVFNARVYLVELVLVVAFEHFFEIGEQVAAPPYAFAFADLPFALLAFQDVLRYQGGVGEGSLCCGFRAELVGFEGARKGFVGVIDGKLRLCWYLGQPWLISSAREWRIYTTNGTLSCSLAAARCFLCSRLSHLPISPACSSPWHDW